MLSCKSESLRTPTQEEPPLTLKERINDGSTMFVADVPIPTANLSDTENEFYQKQCHAELVNLMLGFSERLRKIKRYPQKNIQISSLKRGIYFKLLAPSEFRYFDFTLSDENGENYTGYMYVNTRFSGIGRSIQKPNAFVYSCSFEDTRRELVLRDPIYEPALLKDSKGNKVFVYSCASRIRYKKYDERCEDL